MKDAISEIIEDIYDPTIEDPKKQGLMSSVIKAWLKDAVNRGVKLGREDLALELEVTIKKNLHPDASIAVIGKRI